MDKLKIAMYQGVTYNKGGKLLWRDLEDGEIQNACSANRYRWRTDKDGWKHYWDTRVWTN